MSREPAAQLRLPDGTIYAGKVIAGEVRLKGKKGDCRMVLIFEIEDEPKDKH